MSKIQSEPMASRRTPGSFSLGLLVLLFVAWMPMATIQAGLLVAPQQEQEEEKKSEGEADDHGAETHDDQDPEHDHEADAANHQEEDEHHEDEHHEDEHHEDEHHEDEHHEDEHHDDKAHSHAGDDDHSHDDHHGEPLSNFDYFLNQDWLISHVQDSDHFTIPGFFDHEDNFSIFGHDGHKSRKLTIPQVSPYTDETPLYAESEDENVSKFLGRITFQPTKFIVLMLIAAAFVFFLFVWLANKIKDGHAPQGKMWNALEAMIYFVRDDVAKPSIGSHDYKKFLPFLLTTFFFILTMNLMGMFPLFGTPTSNISVTASLALVVFLIVLFTGMKKLGVVGFWKAQAPHVDVDGPLKYPLTVGIWGIEVFGLFIKHMVLAVRLFANMFAGHLVLAVLIAFIGAMWGTHMNWVIIPGVLGSSLAINILELLVAFIQAYVFTFLTALFIGAAAHPH